MTFWILLPTSLVVFGLFDILLQQSLSHFVDVVATTRRLLLVALLWTATGWLLEARAGAIAADIATTRMTKLEAKLGTLEDSIFALLK